MLRVAHGHIVNQLQKQRKKKKKVLLQHCSSHTQPMSVVFKVCTYRNKSQLKFRVYCQGEGS